MLSIKDKRAAPGNKGADRYYGVETLPSSEFEEFRDSDVGYPGSLQRVAGKYGDGSWGTEAWLVSKELAHIRGDRLVPDSRDAQVLFDNLDGAPIDEKGDIFKLKMQHHHAS